MDMKSMTSPLNTSRSQRSWAERVRGLPSTERRKWIASLSDLEAEAIFRDWGFWARPNQLEQIGRAHV